MEKHGESHAFFIPAAGYWLHAYLPDIYGMNTSTDAAAPIAVFNSRAFRWPFWLCIILMMQAGMGAMFIPILLGAPVWVSVAVLMGVILLMMGLLAGNCTYTLHDGGITQEIRSFSLMPVLKRTVRHFSWSQILYYKAGTDMTKSLEQYNYLYISVSPFPYQLRLSDHQWDKQAFLQFAEAFATQIEIRKQQTPSSSKPSTAAASISDIMQQSSFRRRSFYEKPIAHIIFWILIIGSAVLAWWMWAYGLAQQRHWYRFGAIIVPGLSYMAYRLYRKK